MEQYLLNEKTGVVCVDGTSENDVVVMAEVVEDANGFTLQGTLPDGTGFKATLTMEEYFEGKEFTL